ncbi:hypothetical protein BSF41_36160 [Flavobacterium sp. ACN2]|jgi:hypothetical protein|uniref:hypothetical protein n=1 Tax=Flavobacterium sp. ACN2 TaxID=1975676 RepID=UPI000BB314C0|nr:hypothetical protein [Flavobacterium sp. ACN2]PBI85639.1 hypothetical protein BSF41_36160 [Flavobacterium sp. ACN2]
MKIIKQLLKIIFFSFTLFWFYSFTKCEYLTWKHESEFLIPKEVSSMIDGMSSKKVLEYANYNAIVYYVSSEKSSGDTIYFILVDGKWIISNWETVWSKTGSADGFIWPYIR